MLLATSLTSFRDDQSNSRKEIKSLFQLPYCWKDGTDSVAEHQPDGPAPWSLGVEMPT